MGLWERAGLPGQIFCKSKTLLKNGDHWASLVVQWLGIRLPIQGTRVRALVREDPTCCRAMKPVHHTTEPAHLRARAAQQETPPQ